MKQLLPIVFSVVAVGCATPMQRDIARDIDSESTRAQALLKSATSGAPVYRTIDNTPQWYGPPIDETIAPEPAALDAAATYSHGPGGTLSEAATYLARESGLRFKVTPDAAARAAAFVGGDADSSSRSGGFAFAAQGSLRDVLALLSARSGTSWAWRADHVLIYYMDTQVFDLQILPSTVEDKTTISNATQTTSGQGGGGQGEGGAGQGAQVQNQSGSNQTTDVRYAMNLFDDVERQISVLLSKDGKATVSPATGTVTVRDNESALRAVAAFVDGMNQRLKRQVVVELTVLTVTQSDSDALGINWDAVRRGVGDYYRINLGSLAESPLDAAGLSATVVEPTSPWVGSQVLIEALRKQANATVSRRLIVNAMNSRPARVQAAAQDAFLVNRTTAVVGNSGTALSGFVTRDEITGLSLTLVARILEDRSILLQVAGDITAPLPSKRVSADGVQLELPRKTLDNIFQSAHLANGATLVLTGLQQDDLSTDARGLGSAKFSLFGGGSRASRAQRYVVILLTPRIGS